MEINIEELQEKLDESKSIEPPKSMKELLDRIYQAGELWRKEHTETVAKRNDGLGVKIPLPPIYTVAKELSKIATFTFITKSNTADNSLLYLYDLDEGIYTASTDEFNVLCKTFDNRIKPNDWKQIKMMVRTMTKIRKPLESANLVPVQNGILDLKNKQLRPFDPKYIITSKIATAYNSPKFTPKDREGKTFDDWLSSIACCDSELITLFWQIILEAINPNYTRNKFAILYGDGNNGKGTFQRLLINLIGESNVSALKPAQFSDKFNLETLVGKVCNIGDEAPNERLQNPSDLMSITSGDTVLVNPKGRPAFEATFKIFNIFSGNYIPHSGNKTKGWYRRIMIVPFNADFNGQTEKPWIKNEFLADKDVLEYVLYNDYVLSFVKNAYIIKGLHELKCVPIFIINKRLIEYAENMGIKYPSVYGAGAKIITILKELTPYNYEVKPYRTRTKDFDTLDPWKVYREDLKEPHRSVVKIK